MVGDQPSESHTPSSSSSDPSSSDKEFFKVQRSPNGKLSLVYKEDLLSQAEKEFNKNLTTLNGSSSSCKYYNIFKIFFFGKFLEILIKTKNKSY